MKTQKLTIKIQTNKNSPMTINTNINVPLEMQYYYLSDSNVNPTKVRLIDYNICQSVDNIVLILASVLDIEKGTFKEIFIEDLYDTKNKAIDKYLKEKL